MIAPDGEHLEDNIRLFGWLGTSWASTSGGYSYDQIEAFERDAKRSHVLRGRYACLFCGFTHTAPAELSFEVNGTVWIAPSAVLHYIRTHEYAPPFDISEATRPITDFPSVYDFVDFDTQRVGFSRTLKTDETTPNLFLTRRWSRGEVDELARWTADAELVEHRQDATDPFTGVPIDGDVWEKSGCRWVSAIFHMIRMHSIALPPDFHRSVFG